MLSNVFLFTGEGEYLLHQELNRRKSVFAQKHGSDSIFVFKTNNFDLESIRQSIYGGGLFAQKKLIIVFGLPLDGDSSNKLSLEMAERFIEEFIKKEGKIDPDAILIFVSYSPDKRTRFYNFLNKNLDPKTGIKTFAIQKSAELKQLILRTKPNLSWSDGALDFFIEKTGPSLMHVFNELDKIELYVLQNSFGSVLVEHIELISFGVSEVNGFNFFDTLFLNKDRAIDMIKNMQEKGEYWNAFHGMLTWGLKGLLFVLDCVDQDIKDSKLIASISKLNPFVVNKSLKNINILLKKREKLVLFYKGLIDIEYDIKNGKKSELMFWLYLKEFVYNL